MALEASREAYKAYEPNELKRQERELRRFKCERERRLDGYVPDEVKDESKLERRARDGRIDLADARLAGAVDTAAGVYAKLAATPDHHILAVLQLQATAIAPRLALRRAGVQPPDRF